MPKLNSPIESVIEEMTTELAMHRRIRGRVTPSEGRRLDDDHDEVMVGLVETLRSVNDRNSRAHAQSIAARDGMIKTLKRELSDVRGQLEFARADPDDVILSQVDNYFIPSLFYIYSLIFYINTVGLYTIVGLYI
jgi:hypothetical protein